MCINELELWNVELVHDKSIKGMHNMDQVTLFPKSDKLKILSASEKTLS